MWGLIINGVQATILERKLMPVVPWNGGISKSWNFIMVQGYSDLMMLDSWLADGLHSL